MWSEYGHSLNSLPQIEVAFQDTLRMRTKYVVQQGLTNRPSLLVPHISQMTCGSFSTDTLLYKTSLCPLLSPVPFPLQKPERICSPFCDFDLIPFSLLPDSSCSQCLPVQLSCSFITSEHLPVMGTVSASTSLCLQRVFPRFLQFPVTTLQRARRGQCAAGGHP